MFFFNCWSLFQILGRRILSRTFTNEFTVGCTWTGRGFGKNIPIKCKNQRDINNINYAGYEFLLMFFLNPRTLIIRRFDEQG